MPSKVQVTYSKKFQLYIDALPEKIGTALEICGGMIESHAKELCPVDTGRLRSSITHYQDTENQTESTYTEVIGTNVEYAPYVELGHSQQPGRYVPAIGKRLKAAYVPGKPFLRPAVEQHTEEYKKVIARVLSPDSDTYTA